MLPIFGRGACLIRVFRSLLDKNYALFWSSDFLASVGHFIQEVALYWMTYEMTGSALALGILSLCDATPRLILGVLGGVLVDRYNRMRLLIFNQLFSSVPIFIFVALHVAGALEFWHILVLQIVFGTIRSINPAASHSLLRDLVPADELMNAVSLYTMGFNFARVVGPSLGGVFILWIGVTGCFVIYGVALIFSGLGLLLIRLPWTESVNKGEQNLLREAQEGFRYVWHSAAILSSIGAAYILSIFVGTYQRFLPVFAKEVLSVGPEGLGVLMAAPGLGAVVSLFFLATAGEKWKKETLLLVTASLTPVFLILFCLSRSFLLSVGLLAIVGGWQIAFRTISRVTIQMEVPRELLGRVISVFNLDQGMRSIGSVVIGLFATLFGAAFGLVLTSAISLALTSALFYYFLRPTQR